MGLLSRINTEFRAVLRRPPQKMVGNGRKLFVTSKKTAFLLGFLELWCRRED
jgi:hypothetical protein